MTQLRRGHLNGSSIAAILSAGIGPRIYLAPPDEGASEGAAPSGGVSPEPGAADQAPSAAPEGQSAPSALAQGVAKEGETKAAEAATAAVEGKKIEGADKVKPEGEPKPKDAKDGEPPADAVVKDVDGNPLPEKYEIKMPDGMEMDAKLMEVAAPIFKDTKMSPAQAQAMTDLYTKVQGEAIAQHSAMVAKWADEAKNDPEIGGAKYEENIGKASRAFQAFGNERALQILDTYGLGNNPDILRLFARVGNAMGEGATILPGSGTGRVSDAQALYPNMTK